MSSMFVLTKDLTGRELDAAVAMSAGFTVVKVGQTLTARTDKGLSLPVPAYSTDAGFLTVAVECERIALHPINVNEWQASGVDWKNWMNKPAPSMTGPTPLIAVCRYLVLRAIGEHVEIPE